ncbi:nucleoside diphosphate kinase regulator [Paracoccus acridae]|jgi:regulator of nucleoside diphosphate kinase|uniref:Nucleoside diphosphate kinase regulator n=1 Tax=Paracoccus acridae TaxID=1795310 RepID=A0ABQ1VKR5_9RHOB|nr:MULTISPECIES: nucleoside diphosphate kinase regulator [Paracoccus]GGF75595.1 nucleoside diphosphate kinase regulator [Paracoccus acridae]
MSRSPRRIRAVIDADHVGRLESLADAADAGLPEVAEPLLAKLAAAKVVPARQMPAEVVTIGTALTYRNDVTGREQDVTLAWPEDADISQGAISVLTPIGVALLGLPVGTSVGWTTRTGQKGALTVLRLGLPLAAA